MAAISAGAGGVPPYVRDPISPLMFSAQQRLIMTGAMQIVYEEVSGTLMIQRRDLKPSDAEAELDDNEMVVVTDVVSGQVVSVTVPFVANYWRSHFQQLFDNVRRYLPVEEADLRRVMSA